VNYRRSCHLYTPGLVFLVLTACTQPDRGESEQPQPGSLSQDDFSSLRWLEGSWRGTGGDNPFYERYELVNDTTIRILYYTDSTLATLRDSGSVYFTEGTIYHYTDNALWAAVRSDSAGIHFAPQENASNWFTWSYQSPTMWLAVLRTSDGRETAYRLERYSP